ncbi:C3a anaphylatoxin chemotactic receptor-like [Hemibagrus wyckioides]|uniref:C3a anaphylatoxin chemotactic receptor-like n=1 Tax=Hemibagrus wyckioides TaxID=337641 RepID=UPI00266C4D3A|nr:C3a anaphylatoxin chemotactic receptor-like [Hemibagrus wyckioides]
MNDSYNNDYDTYYDNFTYENEFEIGLGASRVSHFFYPLEGTEKLEISSGLLKGNNMNYSYNYDYDYYDNITFENDWPEESKESIKIAAYVLFGISCFLGVPGNAFVVWIAGVKMKKTVNSIWFLNLAIADLLFCLSIPFTVDKIRLEYDWSYGDAMCKVIPTIIIINMFTSIFTLNLISLDRFIQIVKPVWAQNNRTVRLAWRCCALAWALAILLSLPNLLRETVTSDTTKKKYCIIKYVAKLIFISEFVIGFLLPLLCIVFCYTGIACKIMSSHIQAGRSFRIMLAVVLAFCFSWLPYYVGVLIFIYDKSYYAVVAELYPLLISFTYINSCMNPVLYVFMGQDFKKTIKLSLRRVFEKAFSDDIMVSSQGQQSRCTNSSVA